MNFDNVIGNIPTMNALKRSAYPYVIDYKSLTKDELVQALIKTSPQYYFEKNVREALNETIFNPNRNVRTLTPIILKHILLNKDDFKSETKKINDEVVKFEQNIVNKANEFTISSKHPRSRDLELFSFILETAWDSEDSISLDEKNLIIKIQNRLGISEEEYMIIEASLGKFPKQKNIIHSYSEIEEVKKQLERYGLIFKIRDDEGTDFHVIPTEIADVLKSIFGIEMKKTSYEKMLENKRFRFKDYLLKILNKSSIVIHGSLKLDELKILVLENVKPTNLLGGFSPRDGLSTNDLADWSKELGLPSYLSKEELVHNIIEYYDSFKEKIEVQNDERELYFQYFEDLASRNLETLKKACVITKDLECERKFEKATEYIFEVLLNNDPMDLIGSEHPDGVLSFNDKFIMWDNKSKETSVHLKDHIEQFSRYIKSSSKNVASFLVIGPSFTEGSVDEAMKYQLLNDTVITLITASELKSLALEWHSKKEDEPFPLGYFKQPGKFNSKLISY